MCTVFYFCGVFTEFIYVIASNSHLFWSTCRGGGKESLPGCLRVLIINLLKLSCVTATLPERKKWKRKYCVAVDNHFPCITLKPLL